LSYFYAFNEIRSVTPSSEDAFYPASNLLEHPTYKEYRADTTEATLLFDLNHMATCDSLLMCGPAVSGGMQLTSIILEANTTNLWTTPALSISYDLTADDQINNFVALHFAASTFRYWRLTIKNPGGSYVGLSNLFLGSRTELPVDIGYTFSLMSRSEVAKGRYGQRFIDKLPSIRKLELSMSVMNESERSQLESITHHCETHTPLWILLDSNLLEGGYFYLDKSPEFENQAYKLHNTSLELTEVV
jgi:hypothetical protein